LRWQGHAVTIHEAGPALGGVLRNGIPAYRLPDEVLQRDLARIMKLGVEAHCDSRLDRDALANLQGQFDAVIVCTGLGAAIRLGVEGEDLEGIGQGLAFLDRVKCEPVALQGQVMVVGAGNTAMDCARSALRCGATAVKIVCREGEDMPAIAEEIEGAEQEGIRFVLRRQPIAFTGNGAVSAATLAEVEAGPPDELGRPGFILTQRTSTMNCDKVIVAIGQRTGSELLPADWRVEGWRAWQGETPLDVWLAGDCATGEGTVTHAIGSGRKAALAALASLAGTALEPADSRPPVPPAQILISHFDPVPPQRNRQLAPAVRRTSFEEIDLGPAGPEEAARCFSCGHCTHCDTCLVYCPEGVISRRGDGLCGRCGVLQGLRHVRRRMPAQRDGNARKESPRSQAMTVELLSANHGAAHAATMAARANRTGRGFCSGVYPITPSTECMEYLCLQEIEKGRVIRVESEHSAMGVCIGAAAAGARTFTATASNGLAYMVENCIAAAALRLPVVMAVANRTLGPPWNIWADQGDALLLRDQGLIQFYCADNQEVFDSILCAFRLAEDARVMMPAMVCMEGFILSHTMAQDRHPRAGTG
jgi:thioredoxin reductase